jgi:hypothetical protein
VKSDKLVFPFEDWIAQCPQDFVALKKRLEKLNQYRKSLILTPRQSGKGITLHLFLDDLITFITACKEVLESDLLPPHATFLQHNLQKCHELAAILADTPDITYEQLRIIRVKRIIDPTYLPQHLPRDEPSYPVELEGIGNCTQLENELGKIKKRLRQERREKKEQQALTHLEIAPYYYQNEKLSKIMLSMPTIHTMEEKLNQFKACFSLLKKMPLIQPEEKIELITALEKESDALRQTIRSCLADYPNYSDEGKKVLPIHTVKLIRDHLLSIIKKYKKTCHSETSDLSRLKKAINEVAGDIDLYLKIQPYTSSIIKFNRYTKVSYLNERQREPYRVHLYRGKCYSFAGEDRKLTCLPFYTSGHYSHGKLHWMTFIMNTSGEIFATPNRQTMLHSSFMSGAPVIFAGEIVIKEGGILEISNYSGHYKPLFKHLEAFARHLHQRGVDLARVKFYDMKGKSLRCATCYQFNIEEDVLVPTESFTLVGMFKSFLTSNSCQNPPENGEIKMPQMSHQGTSSIR